MDIFKYTVKSLCNIDKCGSVLGAYHPAKMGEAFMRHDS